MKKLISITLSAAMAAIAVFTGTTAVSAESTKDYSVVSTTAIPDNQVRVSFYGITKSTCAGTVNLLSDSGNLSVTASNLVSLSRVLPVNSDAEYYISLNLSDTENSSETLYGFNETGGAYEKVRFKLYDFCESSWGFNENGTADKEILGETHTYNFKDEGNGYSSALIVISGGAITFASPDEDGYIEAYVSTSLGDNVEIRTVFQSQNGSNISGDSGASYNLLGLAWGDVTQDGSITIDDVTAIQKYVADISSPDSLSERNADADQDGQITIDDATPIQKYLAE